MPRCQLPARPRDDTMAVALKVVTAPFDVPDLADAEEYVTWMEHQPYKLEMTGGRLVMMAGGSNPHATIAGNVFASRSFRDPGCWFHVTRAATSSPRRALPRRRALCTNWKKHRYSGSFSCEMPR